ncbi:uncharacterized protein LOC133532203 [Cydia pomonella]|uniref:uncharacterized protein LOC133532203 n=1 Tax=Cydia pomonella TaxID=82600 RepID=UPI002ADD6F12|nr:uncharacterized protein LOC133532203 [Cydia pomonella]XP_061726747.1 uncharacterized protein LOC133532203 [Cydia pomonella]XP_061726748.1 uncharacterized protein LOC133532203 [Cydia pomonella]
MSDEEQVVSETQVLTAEFKDGQLEIVEVTPFDNNESNTVETILPDMAMTETSEDQEPKYQILTDSSRGLMHLDLLNLTLVKCADGEESYRLVTNQEAEGELGETVTCVLQSSDGEGEDAQNAYVGKKQVYLTGEDQDQYVMVNGEDGPVVILKSSLEGVEETDTPPAKSEKPAKKPLTAVELLEKAKALQKAKAQMQSQKRGRKRRGALPPPHELLSSPNFKLFLYSCKLCAFKCNAIKELTAHKVAEHGPNGPRMKGARAAATTLQCARCPFRGGSHSQLMKHVQEQHLKDTNAEVYLNSAEAEAADVLVCGACGFESASRPEFRRHIEDKHNVNVS